MMNRWREAVVMEISYGETSNYREWRESLIGE